MLQHFLLALYFLLPPVQLETGYIECIPGTLNVILAAPHGGYEEPDNIPDRIPGCFNETNGECLWMYNCGQSSKEKCNVNTVSDKYTKELTQLVANYLKSFTSKRPYVVINNLHRKKLDANREIGEATLGNSMAEEAFNEFHQCIDEAKEAIETDDNVGRTGLFVDIHGHGNSNNWAELGYLVHGHSLNTGKFKASDSSIRYLLSRSPFHFDLVLRGNLSFGHFLEEEGYMAVPSTKHLGPEDKPYFAGGYSTIVHGSKHGGFIDAFQIESSSTNRNQQERESYAAALARSLVNFMALHYTV